MRTLETPIPIEPVVLTVVEDYSVTLNWNAEERLEFFTFKLHTDPGFPLRSFASHRDIADTSFTFKYFDSIDGT